MRSLTRREWEEARRRIVEELGDDVLADLIETSIEEGGFFAEPEECEHTWGPWTRVLAMFSPPLEQEHTCEVCGWTERRLIPTVEDDE